MPPLDGATPVARFLFKKDFSSKKGTVKYRAIVPQDGHDATSIFRIDGLSDLETRRLGDERVGKLRNRDVKARTVFDRARANTAGLDVVADDRPPRHANLVGWPVSKEERISRAQELLKLAELVQR